MGLFLSKEDKEAIQEHKQEVKHEGNENWLHAHGLDGLSDKELEEQITNNINLNFKKEMISTGNNAVINTWQKLQTDYFEKMMEQNWMMIKQNDTLQKQNAEIIALLKEKEGK